MEARHLVLFLDINGTLIVNDSEKNKESEVALLQLLAENFSAVWHEADTHQSLTYRQYATEYLMPKDGKTITAYYQDFLPFLERHQHPLFAQVANTLQTMKQKLTGCDLVPSVVKLVKHLEEKQTPFTIVLRTFGSDAAHVAREFKRANNIDFHPGGHFKNGCLHLDNAILPTAAEWLQNIAVGKHTDWHDDYERWKKNGFQHTHGKPFPVAADDSNQFTLFFDDNVTDKKIICAHPPTGTVKQMDYQADLIRQGRLVAVNTLHAILDDDYYINHVENALKQNARPVFRMFG